MHTMTTAEGDSRDRAALSFSFNNAALTLLRLSLLLCRLSIGYNGALCATVSSQPGRSRAAALSCSPVNTAVTHVNQIHQSTVTH